VILLSGAAEVATPAVVISAFVVCLFGGLWFGFPLARRRP
jgi:hypothetical protein